MVAWSLIVAGCAVRLRRSRWRQQFPTVLAEPKWIFTPRSFLTRNSGTIWPDPTKNTVIDIGAAHVDLLSKAFRGLFEPGGSSLFKGPGGCRYTELVIIPSVREVQIVHTSESYLNVYEVWIKYNLDIQTADAVPIGSWFLPAYGKTPDSMLTSRTEAIEEATIIALRDAGAKLLLDFFRIPAIHGWMQEQQDHP